MIDLVAAIALVCQINSTMPEDRKLECMNFMVNCAIVAEGIADEKRFNTCKTRYQSGERYKEPGE